MVVNRRKRLPTERFAAAIVRRSDFKDELPKVAERLVRHGRDDLADNLVALARLPHETREGIIANARVIMRPYNREMVVRATDNPNVDVRRFIQGEPDTPNLDMSIHANASAGFEGYGPRGKWPVWFVTGEDQKAVAPHMAMMASVMVRTAAQIAGEYERRHNRQMQNLLIASDEQGTIAPWLTFPEDAAKGGNGYQFLSGYQSIGQGTERYGKQILSLLQNIALGSGLRDDELTLFSKLNGETYIPKISENQSENWGAHNNSEGEGITRDWVQVPRVPIDAIANGYPGNEGAFSFFPANSSRHQWVHSTPYFRAAPWFQMLINEGLRVAHRGDAARLRLPLPVMHRHGFMHGSLGQAEVESYNRLLSEWSAARKRLGVEP